MPFRVQGLEAGQFAHLYGLSNHELARFGVERHQADSTPSFPDRIELRDLAVGETALLLNHEHQPASTPYRSRHAIFIREGALDTLDVVDLVPEAIRIRIISLRAFDAAGTMVDADLADGTELEALIERFLSDPEVDYLHAHYAKRGCYAARIVRA